MLKDGITRRTAVKTVFRNTLFWSAVGLFGPGPVIRSVMAMGKKEFPQGFRKIVGDVRVNDLPAEVGDRVGIGDMVTTGPKAHAVFVVGADAYLLRADSRMEISASSGNLKEQTADLIRMAKGRVLSVFGKGEKEVRTSTAIIGVRGTGIYIEAEPELTYLCTCYGTVEVRSVVKPEISERLKARHHEHPRLIRASGNVDRIMTKGPMINHTDAELVMLESMVGRKPPFARKPAKTYRGLSHDDGGNGGGGY